MRTVSFERRPGARSTLGEGSIGEGTLGETERLPGYVGRISGDTDRAIDVARAVDGYLEEIVGAAARELIRNRSAEGYLGEIVGEADRGYAGWWIAGHMIPELVDEIRDWQRLTLVFRSELSVVRDGLRPLNANAGSLSVLERADGSFRATDRAGGDNTIDVEPPFRRRDHRPVRTWHVEEYEEEVIDQDGERYEATLELTASESKTLQEQYDDIADSEVGSEEWLFDFETGSFVTRRVRHNIGKEGSDGVETTMLTLELEPRQVRILEENASKQAAVTVREVPDGSNFVSDAAAENTISLSVPDNVGDGISSGQFAIMEWETEWLNDAFYEASLEIAPIV
ncbi:hypothetical protein [Natrinema thermotolerans]|uniref:hypothetical protein n=1 Tax=Natrinema thermotolerans TaxID=121872 RepID=UPI0006794513|nr:hypothetical protein [Natrinema thermotolerans]QCC57372.1 hypothetical protein DVR14_01440 [Natrinema thermotolerans]